MKSVLRSLLSVFLAIMMTVSIVASENLSDLDFIPENNAEIAEHKDDGKEPDCHTDCDLPVKDDLDDDY